MDASDRLGCCKKVIDKVSEPELPEREKADGNEGTNKGTHRLYDFHQRLAGLHDPTHIRDFLRTVVCASRLPVGFPKKSAERDRRMKNRDAYLVFFCLVFFFLE